MSPRCSSSTSRPSVSIPRNACDFGSSWPSLGRDRAIVLSTHIVADLGSGCTDLALLDRGRVAFRGSPAELVTRAAGEIVEVTVPEAAEGELMNSLEIVSRRPADGQVTVRGVLDQDKGAAPAGARAVSDITLEEAYLAFMVGRGRHADELAMSDST